MTTISWIAFVLCVAGSFMAAHKLRACWAVWLVANLAWSIYAIQAQQWALLATEVFYVALNLYGIKKWKKNL